jgi:hypothetical protein
MSVDNLVKIINVIDNNSKMVGEVTNITKGILAKDPKALDSELVEHVIKNHFGESMYDKIQKIYQELIGT